MDTVSVEKRSKIMAAIHSRDTLPEKLVRSWLFAQGYRFRVCDKKLVGKPDIVLPKLKTIIEIRGCFWHQHGWIWDGRKLVRTALCPQARAPKSNRAFWNAKFKSNVRRDAEHEQLWTHQGWNVIVIWECGLKTAKDRARTFSQVARWLTSFQPKREGTEGGSPCLRTRRSRTDSADGRRSPSASSTAAGLSLESP